MGMSKDTERILPQMHPNVHVVWEACTARMCEDHTKNSIERVAMTI